MILLALILATILVVPGRAAPRADAGDFPTLTPTILPTWTPSLVPTQPEAIVVTVNPYPAPTEAIEGFDPGQPSNIQEEATRLAAEDTGETASGPNPLLTAAYIGLFILLVVGVWMLFSRRGMGNP